MFLPKQNEEKNEARNVGGAHIGLHLESQENADTQYTGDGVVQLQQSHNYRSTKSSNFSRELLIQ